jgi:hypothetical protein
MFRCRLISLDFSWDILKTLLLKRATELAIRARQHGCFATEFSEALLWTACKLFLCVQTEMIIEAIGLSATGH